MKKIAISLVALMATTTSLAAPAVNLMQVYSQAVKSDPTFKQAESTWRSAKEGLPIAIAAYLPTLSGTADYSYDWQNVSPTVSNTTTANGHSRSDGYGLTLTQPIFNWAFWKGIKDANYTVKAATATYNAAIQDLMQRTVTAYINVLAASDKLRYTLARKRAVYRQLETARQKFKVGLIAITGVYDAQSVYDQAAADEIADRNSLNDRLEELREITGQHYRVLYGLGHRVPLLRPKPNNINSWVHTADQQNYTLKSQENTVLAAKENIGEQFAGHLPTLDFSGSYTGDFTFDQEDGAADTRTKQSSFEFALNVPIFQGGLISAQTKQAEYDYLTASGALEEQHRSVVSNTRQSFLGVISGISQIKADIQTIKSSQNALKATEAGYVVGTRTMVDVLNDLSTLYQNQQKYADDQYAYINSIVSLKEQAGTLSVKDLEQINSWFKKRIVLSLPKEALVKANKKSTTYKVKKLPAPKNSSLHNKQKPPKKMAKQAKPEVKKPVQQAQLEALEPPRATQTAATAAGAETDLTTTVTKDRLYAVQFYATHSRLDALNFIKRQPRKFASNMRIEQIDDWYKVIYGNYADHMDASAALRNLPASLKTNRPWVVRAR